MTTDGKIENVNLGGEPFEVNEESIVSDIRVTYTQSTFECRLSSKLYTILSLFSPNPLSTSYRPMSSDGPIPYPQNSWNIPSTEISLILRTLPDHLHLHPTSFRKYKTRIHLKHNTTWKNLSHLPPPDFTTTSIQTCRDTYTTPEDLTSIIPTFFGEEIRRLRFQEKIRNCLSHRQMSTSTDR